MEKAKKRTESKNQKMRETENEKTTFIVLTKQESEVAV